MVQSDEKRAMGKFAPPSGQSQDDVGRVIREKQVGRQPKPLTRLRRQLSSKYTRSNSCGENCNDASDAFRHSALLRVALEIRRYFIICFNLVTSGHSLLHATVAILLYLVFGLVQPIIYGYSLDDKDYKLEVVLVAYLLCVIILTTAKSYMEGANEIEVKTVLYNVITASTASAVGLAIGHLIKRLMGQSHLPPFLLSETNSQNSL